MQSLICPRCQETLSAEPHRWKSEIRGRSSVNPSRRLLQPNGAAPGAHWGNLTHRPKQKEEDPHLLHDQHLEHPPT